MKNREITVSKEANGKIQYLTEILPEIPTNTILYKKLTGLGATYGELKANRNSIIIEPNKPVISGKCKDPKHGKDNWKIQCKLPPKTKRFCPLVLK